jgi:anti-sigma B factor antagonist
VAQADFSAEHTDGVLVVAGEVDMASAPRLRAALSGLATAGGRVTVDLTAVSFLDSAGIAALFEELPSGTEVIVAAGSVAAQVLDITGFHQHGTVTAR